MKEKEISPGSVDANDYIGALSREHSSLCRGTLYIFPLSASSFLLLFIYFFFFFFFCLPPKRYRAHRVATEVSWRPINIYPSPGAITGKYLVAFTAPTATNNTGGRFPWPRHAVWTYVPINGLSRANNLLLVPASEICIKQGFSRVRESIENCDVRSLPRGAEWNPAPHPPFAFAPLRVYSPRGCVRSPTISRVSPWNATFPGFFPGYFPFSLCFFLGRRF